MLVSTFKYTLYERDEEETESTVSRKLNQDNGVPVLVQTKLHRNIDKIIP